MNMLEKLSSLKLAAPIAVIGMGKSGQTTLRLLREAGYDVTGFDERAQKNVEQVSLDDATLFMNYRTLVVSPGVDRRKRAIATSNAEVMNDVEIFARLVEKPVAAVTGSNGKSTVVSMLAESCAALGMEVRLCGNIGRPVLDALFDAPEATDLYVVELSSYQLEVCPSLRPDVGAVLNLSPDHLDRYNSYADYVDAKANLARQAAVCILNADDAECQKMAALAQSVVWFGRTQKNAVKDGKIVLDDKVVLDCEALKVHGKPNHSNALVTLLLGKALGIDVAALAENLKDFKGLAHRLREISRKQDIFWLDDSKATNIGAAAAALHATHRPTWLIAGGVGKGQDFSEFAREILAANVKQVLLIGVDNRSMTAAFDAAHVDYVVLDTMARAVAYAAQHAVAGEQVLLSPATASFDQYAGFALRGDDFAHEVEKI